MYVFVKRALSLKGRPVRYHCTSRITAGHGPDNLKILIVCKEDETLELLAKAVCLKYPKSRLFFAKTVEESQDLQLVWMVRHGESFIISIFMNLK